MSVLDLILSHDPQARLLWETRCDCAADGRCRSHFALTSAPVSMAYLVIRMGVPTDKAAEVGEHVKTLKVPFDAAAIQVVPGLFLTPLGKATNGQLAP